MLRFIPFIGVVEGGYGEYNPTSPFICAVNKNNEGAQNSSRGLQTVALYSCCRVFPYNRASFLELLS